MREDSPFLIASLSQTPLQTNWRPLSISLSLSLCLLFSLPGMLTHHVSIPHKVQTWHFVLLHTDATVMCFEGAIGLLLGSICYQLMQLPHKLNLINSDQLPGHFATCVWINNEIHFHVFNMFTCFIIHRRAAQRQFGTNDGWAKTNVDPPGWK